MNAGLRQPARSGRAWRKVALALAVLAVLLVVAWSLLLPVVVARQLEVRSGFGVEVGTLRVNPFGGRVLLEDFRLSNPPDRFPVAEFVALRRLEVRLRPRSLAGERLDIVRAELDLEKITVVTSRDRSVNVNVFRNAFSAKDAVAPKDAEDEPARPFIIRELVVRIGRIEMIDFSRGGEPVRQTIELGIDRRFRDVTAARTVVAPLVADLVSARVRGQGGDALGSALRALGGASGVDRTGEGLKKLFDSLRGTGKP